MIGGQSIVRVFHLFFADDTLVFCDADRAQLFHLRQVLTWFQVVSGVEINLKKCEIILVGEVENIEVLAQVMNCKIGALQLIWTTAGSI